MRTFLEVNRTRHFGKAGEHLHITQAAVSARIKLLESHLGETVFIRRYKDLQLTPEGNRLVRHAELLMAGWRKARQEVAVGGSFQQLTAGGSLRLWDVALQDWFHALRKRKPDMGIIAESLAPDQLTRRLLDGHLDIIFMLDPPQLETLQIVEVAAIDLIMVTDTPGIPVESALEGDYLMVDWGITHGLEHRRLFPDAPEPRIRVSQAKMALEHILALGGSAYLPVRMVGDYLAKDKLSVVTGAPVLQRHAYAVFPVRSEKLDLIREVLGYFEYSVSIPPSLLQDT